MAWNTLTRPVYGGPAQQPDFFNRSKTNSVRQLSLAKVPGADPMIKSSFDTAAGLRASQGRDAGRYRSAFESTLPQVSGYLDQDLGDISRYFSPGGYESDLAGIRDRRSTALTGLNDQILAGLRRTLSSRAVGGGNTGLGSYLSRIAAGEAGKVRTQEAYDRAGQERADLATLLAGRNASYGRRSGLVDSSLARLLMPAQYEQNVASNYNTNLGSALQLALQNLISAYATPGA